MNCSIYGKNLNIGSHQGHIIIVSFTSHMLYL